MKIRDLNKYIQELCGCDSFDVWDFEKQNFKLFSELRGKVNSFKTIESYIEDLTSFANSSYKQIFFEMLQNARDAGAKDVLFYYEQDGGMLILNNGNSFSTSISKIGDSLEGFLIKDHGNKRDDDDKLGKYGKGSKLLYNLLVSEKTIEGDTRNRGERLLEQMCNNRLAPILYSWNKRNLKELINITSVNELYRDENLEDNSNSLLCMLLFSYFPLMPNQEVNIGNGVENIFNEGRFKEFQFFLSRFYNKYKSESIFFDKGTLLYIPSPKAVSDELKSENEDIINDLTQAFTLLCLDDNKSQINKIFLNDCKISNKEVYDKELRVKSNTGSHDVSIVYSNNPEINVNNSNIMMGYFSVYDEKYGLAYSIRCNDFDIEESRQRLQNNDQLFTLISEEIYNLWETWTLEENYCSFVNAIALSELNERGKEKFEVVHSTLVENAKKKIPTNSGEFMDSSSVAFLPDYIFDSPNGDRFLSLLEDLSYNKKGAHKDIYEYSDAYEKWGVESVSISKLLSEVDKEILVEYFDNSILNKNKIFEFLNRELKDKRYEVEKYILNIPFIELGINKSEYYSINDIINKPELFLLPSNLHLLAINRSLCDLGVKTSFNNKLLYTDTDSKYIQDLIFEKYSKKVLKNKLEDIFESKNSSGFEAGIKLIENLREYDEKYFEESIKNKLFLFSDNNRNVKTLSNLIPKIDFDVSEYWQIDSQIDDKENILLEYMSKRKQWWDILYKDKSKLEKVIEDSLDENGSLNDYYLNLINECCDLVDKREECCDLIDKREVCKSFNKDFKILLSNNNIIEQLSDYLFTRKMANLNKTEYRAVERLIDKTPYKPINFDLLKLVKERNSNFTELGKIDFSRLDFESYEVSHEDIKVLKKIIGDHFFDFFIIKESNGEFILSPRSNSDIQFYSEINEIAEFLDNSSSYYSLPCNLIDIFSEDSSLRKLNKGTFLNDLIDKFGSREEFIKAIKKYATPDVVKKYISLYKNLDLSSDEEYDSDNFEYQFIEMSLKREYNIESLRSKILIDNKPINNKIFKDEVIINNHKSKKESFSLEDLLPGKYVGAKKINKIVNCFKNIYEIDSLFKLEEIDHEELYNNLRKIEIKKEEQFYFLCIFCINNKDKDHLKYNDLDISLSKEDCLNLFFEKDLNFTKCFVFDDFNPDVQIFTEENELLLDSEIIPAWVKYWSSELKKKEYLSKNLKIEGSDSPVLKFRGVLYKESSLKENIEINNSFFKKKYLIFIINTAKWVCYQNWNIKNDSNRAKSLFKLSSYIINKDKNDNLFALEIDSFKSNDEYFLKFKNIANDNYYYYRISKNDKYIKYLKEYSDKNHLKVFLSENKIEKNKVYKNKEISFSIETQSVRNIDKEEWNYGFYKQWIKDDLNSDIRIYNTSVNINTETFIKYEENNESIMCSVFCENGDFGISSDNEIFLLEKLVQTKYKGLELLEENQEVLFEKNISALTKLILYSTKYPEDDSKIETRTSNSISNNHFSGDAVSSNTDGKKNIASDIDDFVLDKLNEVADKLNSIDIELLLNFIKNPEVYKEKVAKPNNIVGHIGEALVNYWYKIEKHQEIKWSSQEMVAEYDFKLNDDTYIDVKTNKGNIKEDSGSAPIYVKKSQRDFIKNNGDSIKYNIVRIGLKNLGIEDWFADENELSDSLKEKINAKVENYLKNENNLKKFNKELISFRLQRSEF